MKTRISDDLQIRLLEHFTTPRPSRLIHFEGYSRDQIHQAIYALHALGFLWKNPVRGTSGMIYGTSPRGRQLLDRLIKKAD